MDCVEVLINLSVLKQLNHPILTAKKKELMLSIVTENVSIILLFERLSGSEWLFYDFSQSSEKCVLPALSTFSYK